jgi:hypothetical protein
LILIGHGPAVQTASARAVGLVNLMSAYSQERTMTICDSGSKPKKPVIDL